jgi:hypothetical protein
LRGYKWFINARGYANIAPTKDTDPEEEVWGLVYDLSPADESRLDVNEGVPYAYEKRIIPVEFWPVSPSQSSSLSSTQQNGTTTSTTDSTPDGDSTEPHARTQQPGTTVPMLIYIDYKRTTPNHRPRAEYVHRMNMGIRDALREGVPLSYIERALRPYIPADAELDAEAVGLAKRQAAGFRDESGVIPGVGLVKVQDAAGSGVVSSAEMGVEEKDGGVREEEEEELPERASEVCYLRHFGV